MKKEEEKKEEKKIRCEGYRKPGIFMMGHQYGLNAPMMRL